MEHVRKTRNLVCCKKPTSICSKLYAQLRTWRFKASISDLSKSMRNGREAWLISNNVAVLLWIGIYYYILVLWAFNAWLYHVLYIDVKCSIVLVGWWPKLLSLLRYFQKCIDIWCTFLYIIVFFKYTFASWNRKCSAYASYNIHSIGYKPK